jgi:hypothetical protein
VIASMKNGPHSPLVSMDRRKLSIVGVINKSLPLQTADMERVCPSQA